ncbi:MAG: hypothetical protein JWM41_4118 [Gemmatimonadetes bacterium]|nr:hypothetical protein [Gemmatimonadota bacterium]
MGYETKCHARVDDRTGTIRQADNSTVLLETDDLIVRGEARVKVPRASIERMATRAGVLTITSPAAVVSLTLGDDAGKWRKKLEEAPKRLIDKLDVTPGARGWIVGIDDETLIEQILERTPNVARGRSASSCDVVFVGVESDRELDRIDRAVKAIVDRGAIWVVHRKGPSGVADTTIFGRAKSLGLTYTKVARVSETHTAEKLVRPVASRAKPPR